MNTPILELTGFIKEVDGLRKRVMELEEENAKLKEMQTILLRDNQRLNEEIADLMECDEDYDEELYYDDENYDDYDEEDDKSFLDLYHNPLGFSMREAFIIGEEMKDKMSPAEKIMYEKMKEHLGITQEDLVSKK